QTILALELAADGSNLHAFWTVTAAPSYLEWYSRSTDDGATWSPALLIGVDGYRNVFCSGATLIVDTRPPMRSTDAGVTWSPLSIPGLASPLISGSGHTIVAAEEVITVVTPPYTFRVTQNVNLSRDGGQTWLPAPVQPVAPWVQTATTIPTGTVRDLQAT